MPISSLARVSIAAVSCAFLLSCGGSGGSIKSTPVLAPTPTPSTPAPTPSPSPSPPQLTLLRDPATQEFSSYSSGDTLRARYDRSTGTYEVNSSGAWEKLFPNPTGTAGAFLIGAGTPEASSGFGNGTSSASPLPTWRYQYSSLANWYDSKSLKLGWTVFGEATAAEAIPVTGTAAYNGLVRGSTSASADGGGWGIIEKPDVSGSIDMQVDFSRGTLSGELSAGVYCDCVSAPVIPKASFSGQIASGSGSLSGQFATILPGTNSFEGLFAGPTAQEAMGTWAFPYLDKGTPATVSGVWIAKK